MVTGVTIHTGLTKRFFLDKFKRMSKFFDIPGRKFDFTKDLEYGLKGESLISEFLKNLSDGNFEVKSDRYRNGRMVVETQQNPRAAKNALGDPLWLDSGINITTARWWVYIYAPEGAFVVVSVERLKRFLRANGGKYTEETKVSFGGSDNPARGFLLQPNEVMDMLFNPLYDAQQQEKETYDNR